MVELLKQPQYQPLEVVDQVMAIFAANKGALDDVPVNQVSAFEKAFVQYMRDSQGTLRTMIAEKKDLLPEFKEKLLSAIAEFKRGWKPAAK